MTDLDSWTRHLAETMGVSPDDFETNAVLDLARVAAHGVARPAAPVTTFLAGYAAGLRGGGPEVVARSIASAEAEVGSLNGDPDGTDSDDD